MLTPLPMFLNVQPIPYQGSKRKAASRIFQFAPERFETLYEPFAGSAAVTLFAASRKLTNRFVINDSCAPLAELLRAIIAEPEICAAKYERLWGAQLETDRSEYYAKIRNEFNQDKDPIKFLFLVTKCVKNAVRFNSAGEFNQSADKRRLGRSPEQMRKHILYTSLLLQNKATVLSTDYAEVISQAGPNDLVYMDPPYLGTSATRDTRYHQGIDLERLVHELEKLNKRDVPYLLSFDGSLGEKTYGYLPEHLGLNRIEINMGRSAQATLNGRDDVTVESLYVSPALVSRQQTLEVAV